MKQDNLHTCEKAAIPYAFKHQEGCSYPSNPCICICVECQREKDLTKHIRNERLKSRLLGVIDGFTVAKSEKLEDET